MKKRKVQAEIIWTVILILAGLSLLLSSFEIVTIEDNIYFYAAMALMGVVFHIMCFVGKPKKYNLLVPGGMMIIFAALFIACEYSSRFDLDALWPVIILAAAFGMVEQIVFSKGEEGNWLSVIVISIVGFHFLLQNNPNLVVVLGAILILIGVLMVVKISRKIPKEKDDTPVDTSDLEQVEVPAVKPAKEETAPVESSEEAPVEAPAEDELNQN